MSLELYIGPMFAGKSSTALRLVHRNAVIGRKTFCVTSSLDVRYKGAEAEAGCIVSHTKDSVPAVSAEALLPLLGTDEFKEAACVIIEEAQFFSDLFDFVMHAVEVSEKEVICIGLDGDSERRPFGELLDLIPYANSVTKLSALCTRCNDGTAAIFTFRKHGSEQQIHVGGSSEYEALCRKHYREGQYENHVKELCNHILEHPKLTAMELLEHCISSYGLQEGTDLFNNQAVPSDPVSADAEDVEDA
jgi:thymidine kinase